MDTAERVTQTNKTAANRTTGGKGASASRRAPRQAGEAVVNGERIGVIGGGLGGLAAACVLAARGHKVVLFDKNPWLGGKAAELVEGTPEGNFRFDMGPTILTVPAVLERIFAEAGENMHQWLDLKRLDPQWRCFFEDGSVLDLEENVRRTADNIAAFATHKDAAGYEEFIRLSENLHRISNNFFFWKSVEGLGDTMNLRENMKLSTLQDVLALRMGQTVAGTIRSHVPDARVSQMLDHFTQYVGSSPYASPAVLCAIAHMQTSGGVWYPMGGTRAVPVALTRLAEKLGVDLRPGVEISRVLLDDENRACGVVTASGESIKLQAVVSNMDSVRTHRELLPEAPREQFERSNRYKPACSGVVLYLGLKKRYEHLLHHNFVFSRDAEEEFDSIYNHGRPAADPTCYVAAPSVSETAVAPEGGEALYVLVHTPPLQPGQLASNHWQRTLPQYRQVIIDKLKRTGGMPDLEERIVVERTLTPQDIHERYKVLDGAIYGLASHGRFLGAFKPGNRSKLAPGLYLAGGSAHPGPGMPMVMMSGWIAADCLDQDLIAGTVGQFNPDITTAAHETDGDAAARAA